MLQVIDWIHRHEWTEQPPCVHPVLQKLALRANDGLPDGERQKLLDLVPRLIGTASGDNRVLTVRLVFCARYTASHAAAAYATNASVYSLLATLDEYERLTGRTTAEPVDLAPVARMMAEAAA